MRPVVTRLIGEDVSALLLTWADEGVTYVEMRRRLQARAELPLAQNTIRNWVLAAEAERTKRSLGEKRGA